MTTRQLSFKGPPQLAIAAEANTPNPGIPGVQIWSTLTNSILVWDGSKWYAPSSGGGGMVGHPLYIQETEPLVASPYIWYKTDTFGNVIDILKG